MFLAFHNSPIFGKHDEKRIPWFYGKYAGSQAICFALNPQNPIAKHSISHMLKEIPNT
jgi:hypothetical protein